MSLGFKSETVKEASFEMRHNNSWREEKLLYHNPARKALGREREVQILNILLKELEGERLRAVMWLGCNVDTLIFALL